MAARRRGEGRTPHRTIRVEDDPWEPFKENAKRVDSDASDVLRVFMAWFNREPGAKMPKRPEGRLPDDEYNRVMGFDES